MSNVLHVFRKDFARLWLAVLASSFVLAFGYFLTVANVDPTFHFMSADADKFRKGLLDVGWAVAPFFLAVWVIQQDLLVNDRAVWLTRPISASEMLIAKFLFLVAAIAVPVGIVSFFAACWLKTPLGIAAINGMENASTSLFAASLGALIASLTGSMKNALLLLATILGALALTGFIVIRFHLSLSPIRSSATAGTLATSVLAIPGLAVAIANQYATRRGLRTIVIGVILCFLAAMLGDYWSAVWGRPASALPDVPGNIFEAQAESSGVVFAPRQTQSGEEVDVEIPLNFDWQRPDRTFVLMDISASLTLPGGKTLPTIRSEGFSPEIISNFGQTLSNDRRALLAALGMQTREMARKTPPPVAAFAMSEWDYAQAKGRTTHLSLHLDLMEIHYVVVARMPAVMGAEVRQNGQLWRIHSIEFARSGGFDLDLQFARVESFLARPSQWSARRYTQPGYLLVNTKCNQFSFADRVRLSGVSAQTISLRADRPGFVDVFDSVTDRRTGNMDNDWLRDAELCIFEAEPVADVRKDLQLDGFVLSEPNGHH